jgi:death on curing protein
MSNWIWVLEATALAIHSEQLREHGGGEGVRDAGLLQSALARPENLAGYAGYGDPDVAALAASYAFGIARNHPFIDGNKRTAYVVGELFLALNGFELMASDADAVMTFLALAAGELSEEQLAAWIRANIVAI